MGKPVKYYWDSCAFIGLINGEPDKKRELEIIYRWGQEGEAEIWTSTLSMMECRSLKGEHKNPKPMSEENGKKISDIFLQQFIKPIPMTVEITASARSLWRKTKGLDKIQDAVHVESALRWNINLMHTYDRKDLLHLNGQLICKNGEKLLIAYPDATTDGDLFSFQKEANN